MCITVNIELEMFHMADACKDRQKDIMWSSQQDQYQQMNEACI